MQPFTFQVGAYEVNCTLVPRGEGAAWVVDPGAEPERILAELAARSLVPSAILLTHAHFDHIGAIAALQAKWPDLPVYAHPADFPAFAHPMNCCPPDYPAAPRPRNLTDCRTLGGVAVIETPGHTPGGVCYHFAADALLLSGDTLFAGSVGRTDFPGGDMAAMRRSLKVLEKLPGETLVVPGHGPFTTIAAERAGNPYFL